jgi:A/G-specific adenine glycosylase
MRSCEDRGAMQITEPLLGWYDRAARDLPWRGHGVTPWAVLVSEIMLQQTPVLRVRPVYEAWLRRWPEPAALAADPVGDAVRLWGKLGYPRRALRLHECATVIVDRYGGTVPDQLDLLRALPGVGEYTARAVAVFAFDQRHPVVDTNVRRVVARFLHGDGAARAPSPARDHAAVDAFLPLAPPAAARVSVALMELGALVCTARSPSCSACPLASGCAWRLGGAPGYLGPRRRTQRFTGTDRQARGRLLEVVRGADRPVHRGAFDVVWTEPVQRERALAGLVSDGLVVSLPDGRFALPG